MKYYTLLLTNSPRPVKRYSCQANALFTSRAGEIKYTVGGEVWPSSCSTVPIPIVIQHFWAGTRNPLKGTLGSSYLCVGSSGRDLEEPSPPFIAIKELIMGHILFLILHFFAIIFGLVLLFITVPAHIIYACLHGKKKVE